jgi:hypothetical protein
VKPATESIYLPMLFLSVALLGGLRMANRMSLVPPPPFALVLGVLFVGVIVRGRVVTPQRLMSASRSPLENLSGLVVVLSLFFAATQIFNLLIPEAGLPFLSFNLFFFVLLVNTLVGSPDRLSVLRSVAVIIGSAYILKFVVLGALSDPAGGAVKRVLLVLLEGVTLGTLTQPPLDAAAAYIAFVTLVLFLIGLAMLEPARGRGSLPPAGQPVALIESDE